MKQTAAFFIVLNFLLAISAVAQVGIGTQTPHAKAVLEIKSTDKGVLFPRLTSAQRDAITAPPDGLHIFNTDESCLNYYDSAFASWSCYCDSDSCKVMFIRIVSSTTNNINFNTAYAANNPAARKFVILVPEGVAISGINFSTLPANNVYKIKITNRGTIYGQGGAGGNGGAGQGGSCSAPATNGGAGFNAINTRFDIRITVDNFGLIAGGGGGGGGGGKSNQGQYGGGGGGGAGSPPGIGGTGGGNTSSLGNCFITSSIAAHGSPGTTTAGGIGGSGANGGGAGGTGGGWAQIGGNGTGTLAGIGGAAGKAIASGGGASNSVIFNLGSGQTFGVVE